MTNDQTVLVELFVAAPIEAVWRALREPAAIARWFGWDYEGLTPEIAEIFERHATVEEPGRRLTIAGTGDLFVLEPRGQGTMVRLIRAAPAEGSWDDIYDDVIEGWTMFLHQLRFALERHPADTRRTLYLSGRSRAAADPAPVDAFGLSSVAVVQPGDRFAVRLATGDTIEGTVWYRTRLQLGVTVDALGDGLLILTRSPTTSRSPHGGGALTLTTYGMSTAAFDALRARWHDWWVAAYELIEAHPGSAAAVQ